MDSTPNWLVDTLKKYDNGTLKRGDVSDFVWRAEQAVGAKDWEGLFKTKLAKRFPTFAAMMAVNSSKKGWGSCQGCNFNHNIFLNNSHNFGFNTRVNGSLTQVYDEEALKLGANCLNADGSRNATFAEFPGADNLEFVLASEAIDTKKIGLRCDEFRRHMPMPHKYRPWVRQFFDGVPSFTPICWPKFTGPAQEKCEQEFNKYTPAAASLRASMRSGLKLLEDFTEPCPPLTSTDCEGELVPWGECEADGTMVMRFTVEAEAAMGGKPCERHDGEEVRVKC